MCYCIEYKAILKVVPIRFFSVRYVSGLKFFLWNKYFFFLRNVFFYVALQFNRHFDTVSVCIWFWYNSQQHIPETNKTAWPSKFA